MFRIKTFGVRIFRIEKGRFEILRINTSGDRMFSTERSTEGLFRNANNLGGDVHGRILNIETSWDEIWLLPYLSSVSEASLSRVLVKSSVVRSDTNQGRSFKRNRT